MRLLPLLTAVMVTAALYLLVMEREALLAFANGDAGSAAEAAAEPGAEDEVQRVRVVALRSSAREVDTGVLLRGRTEAARQVDVRAEVSSTVISEPLRKGRFVETGELLCRLDPGTRRAALTEAEARLAEALVNYRAASGLKDQGFASETRVASAKAALQSAEAAVDRAQTEIDRLEIRAPFGGLLETDTAENGTLLQPGAVCATVIQLDPIRLVGFVPEVDVSRIALGAPADAQLADGARVRGAVTFISRSADPQTRTFRVDVEVANPELTIRAGQTAEILISADGETAHALPASALTLDDAGRIGIRAVVDGDTVRFMPVEILRDTRDGVYVTGLPAEVDVIVTGQEYVTDGRKVAVTYREDGA